MFWFPLCRGSVSASHSATRAGFDFDEHDDNEFDDDDDDDDQTGRMKSGDHSQDR